MGDFLFLKALYREKRVCVENVSLFRQFCEKGIRVSVKEILCIGRLFVMVRTVVDMSGSYSHRSPFPKSLGMSCGVGNKEG